MTQRFGIASMGLAFPTTALKLTELAHLRGVDPEKYSLGLGCYEMAVACDGITVVDLAVQAARKALARWSGHISDIGLLAVGTESAYDLSRPLSAFIAEQLNIGGYVRSYEVKHACLGGTLAVRQALEWQHAGVAPGKAALVIATDIAAYEPNSPGEPTQGAGAVAMIIAAPTIAEISLKSFAWSQSAYDFWRPIKEEYPRVNGPLSLKTYIEAAKMCFQQMRQTFNPQEFLEDYRALCFHVPFPKITLKTLHELGQLWGWSTKSLMNIYDKKVDPFLKYNRITGNCYTASLWLSVAHALTECQKQEHLLAFSYGSGCGAELLRITKTSDVQEWHEDLQALITQRRYISAHEYDVFRQNT